MARAGDCGPIRPPMPCAPPSTLPSTTTPPPTPVPAMTPNTTSAPAPAPSVASDRAKQLASLASRTGRAQRLSRSRRSGLPFSQVVLAFLIRPVPKLSLPGIAMPTLPGVPSSASAPATSSAMARNSGRIISRRGDAPAQHLRRLRPAPRSRSWCRPDRCRIASAPSTAQPVPRQVQSPGRNRRSSRRNRSRRSS